MPEWRRCRRRAVDNRKLRARWKLRPRLGTLGSRRAAGNPSGSRQLLGKRDERPSTQESGCWRSTGTEEMGSRTWGLTGGQRNDTARFSIYPVLLFSFTKFIRSARFEQIWKSRKGDIDSLRKIYNLYDVVRVDGEDKKPSKKKEVERISPEDNAILCNYLPLLREYIPSAVEEIESEIKAYVSSEVHFADGGSGSVSTAIDTNEDGYLYDLYTVEEFIGDEEEISLDYPSVQVKNEDDFNDMPDSNYDSEDSNAEDHPRNDYPDEESLEDVEVDPFGDSECLNSDYELEMDSNSKKDEKTSNNGDEDMEAFSNSEYSNSEDDDEDNLRWGYR